MKDSQKARRQAPDHEQSFIFVMIFLGFTKLGVPSFKGRECMSTCPCNLRNRGERESRLEILRDILDLQNGSYRGPNNSSTPS